MISLTFVTDVIFGTKLVANMTRVKSFILGTLLLYGLYYLLFKIYGESKSSSDLPEKKLIITRRERIYALAL